MENLGIDSKLLIAQLVNFGIFFFLFYRFMAKPFAKFLQNEKKKEEDKNHLLADLKKRDESLAEVETEMRKKVKKEANDLLKQARLDAENVKKEIVAEAEKEAKGVVERAKKQIDEERTQLYKEVKTRALDLSVILVNKALKDYLNEDSQKKLTQHILTNLSKDSN